MGGELDLADISFTVTTWIQSGSPSAESRVLRKGNESDDSGSHLAVTADREGVV